jgi:hypothetical protein
MDALVSRALMTRLSLHPSPASETSALPGSFPSESALQAARAPRRSASQHTSLPKSPFAAMIASSPTMEMESESPNPFKLAEAGD